jgi:GT2 family glycosyltransferase
MPLPRFTIVVPTYERPQALRRCLQSIARLRYPPDRFDVIVVDDGSGCAPEAEVAEASREFDVQLLTQFNAGPGAARNAGVARATGTYVAFLGDDCEPAVEWLEAFARQYVTSPQSLLGGRIVNTLPGDPFATASDRLIGFLYARYNRDPDRAQFFTPNNMAVPRARFLEIGGFDATTGATGEDRELCDRWRARGSGIVYVADAVVCHTHPLTFAGFWNQQIGYGRGTCRYRQRQHTPRAGRIAPERLSFYVQLVRFPFSVERGGRAWVQATLLGISQIATALGFLLESIEERRRNLRLTARSRR